MAYADYVFYKLTYKGSLSEAAFDSYSERASDYIDSRTEYIFRSGSVPDELMDRIKRACCAITDAMYKNDSGGVKTSERVGDYSVSYAASKTRSEGQRLDDAIQLYLADVVKAVKWV